MVDTETQRRKRLFLKKRKWVNMELRRRTKGKHISNVDRSTIMNEIWIEANNKYGS